MHLALLLLVTVTVLSAGTGYLILEQGTLFAGADGHDTYTLVFERDGTSLSVPPLTEAERRSIYVSALGNGKATLNGKSLKASVSEGPSGETLILLSAPSSIYGKLVTVLVITCIVTAVWFAAAVFFLRRRVENDVILPIEHLSESFGEIEGGNYDCLIQEEGKDEILALMHASESLRVRLKDEVYKKEKAEEDRRFLISAVSHDLRTPVAAVRGYLEGIRDSVADTKEKRDNYINKAIERLDSVGRMTDDLLTYSRLDSGGASYNISEVELSAYLSDFAEEEAYGFIEENKSLSFKNEGGMQYILADPEKLARVIRNITQNAKKYIAEETGRVEIILRRTKSGAVIEIADNGEGIEPDELQRIFDRFYRGAKARTFDGSVGLGLAISKRIVEDLGGRIWAKSRLGQGTSFMISFPADRVRGENNEENFAD